MALPPSDDDRALIDELRAALDAAGPVPPEFLAAGRAAFAWRDIDAQLAELTFDSARDPQLATRTGPDAAGRLLAFAGGGLNLEVEVSDAGLTGQLSPAGAYRISCQSAAGTLDETTADPVGCFVLRAPPKGPVRLRVSGASGAVATSWITLG